MRWRIFLKWRWIRLLRLWNKLPIRAQGGVWVLLPAVALLVSFLTAIYGNRNRDIIETDIQRKFSMVRQLDDLLTLLVDTETGVRGFLLTGRREFLEPYRGAIDGIAPTLARLNDLAEAEPGKKPRVEKLKRLSEIQTLVDKQISSLESMRNFVSTGKNSDELYGKLQTDKNLMDGLRRLIGEMKADEATLLTERIQEINSIRQRDYIVIFISLLIGLIARLVSFYLFDRGIVRRIQRIKENVSSLIKGESMHFPVSEKIDALGLLEEEIVKLGEERHLENKRTTEK